MAHTLGKIHHFETALPAGRACLERLMQDGDASVRKKAEDSLNRIF